MRQVTHRARFGVILRWVFYCPKGIKMAQNIKGPRSYTHTAESNADLVKKILGRNLQADPAELLALLESVGYYRLKGYLIPFYLPKTEVFAPSTTLNDITNVYMFDRHLREMALDAIARLEVALRPVRLVRARPKGSQRLRTSRATLEPLPAKSDHITNRSPSAADPLT